MQRYVAGLWHGLLGKSDFGLHDSFFEAGGHSLLAMQMVTQLRKHGAGDLEMTDLFELPTVAGLADKLEKLGMRPPEYDTAAAGQAAPAPAPAAGPPHAPLPGPDPADEEFAELLAEVESLSDDEVRARLAELDRREGQ
jgi:aryl carrier-like protein